MEEQLQQHEKCRREAEELQETIFDLEQQIAGIDIEVERRVRIISQAVQQEI
jgi:predicted  nucleic acid-binding Zn-ribbon protein